MMIFWYEIIYLNCIPAFSSHPFTNGTLQTDNLTWKGMGKENYKWARDIAPKTAAHPNIQPRNPGSDALPDSIRFHFLSSMAIVSNQF